MHKVLSRPILVLALGHLTVDFYVGFIPLMYPLLIERFSLNLSTVGMLSLAYVGASSLSQPFFGWLADRWGPQVLRFALLWTAAVFAAVGFASSFGVLLALATVAGLGSGAYHPFGAVSIASAAPERTRNSATSIYVSGGYIGVALGPLAGVALLSVFGLKGVLLTALPGLFAGLWLLREFAMFPRVSGATANREASNNVREAAREDPPPQGVTAGDTTTSGRTRAGLRVRKVAAALPLAAVVCVMMSRNWNLYAVQAYLPAWYNNLGYGPLFYGALSTVILLATALGTVACGWLADRLGKRTVVAGTVVLSVPALAAFAAFPGPAAFLSGAFVGLLCAAAAPLMLVTAQQLVGGRTGLASGIVLGLGFVTGAVGVPATGLFADVFGLEAAMLFQAVIAAATIPIVFLLPSEKRLVAH